MKTNAILISLSCLMLQDTWSADQTPATKGPVVDLGSHQDAMAVIRKQLALALSENKEQASLEDALATCRRLAAPSFIIDLLSDPRYGWKRMAPTTLCYNDDSYTFVIFTYRVHEALFERWGELDLDGALKRLPPPVGDGDFDEGQVITFNLYKGAASVRDGKHVFDTLIPPGSDRGLSEHGSCALRYLMEGWARSDPDAAWTILVSHPSMVNAGRGAIRGYFKGLNSHTPWEKLAHKVEAYCAKDQFIAGAEAKGEFRRGLASAWLRHDPAAALAWFASNCTDPHPNYGDKAEDVRVVVHAVIITEWLKDDLAGATRWLATWQSDRISTAKVLAYIAAQQKTLPPLNANPRYATERPRRKSLAKASRAPHDCVSVQPVPMNETMLTAIEIILMIADELCSWRVWLCIGIAVGIVAGLYYKYPEQDGIWSVSLPAAIIVTAIGGGGGVGIKHPNPHGNPAPRV